MQAQLAFEIQTDITEYARSMSSQPLMRQAPRLDSWLTRLEEKVRSVYQAITCTRTEDVVRQPRIERPPPRVPSRRRRQQQQQEDPRHEEETQYGHDEETHHEEEEHHDEEPHREEESQHRHDPRPRLSQEPTPPHPNQAGSSAWQQLRGPMPAFPGFQYQHGMYIFFTIIFEL